MRELSAIRADLPALAGLAYLNTGTAGPLPLPVAEAMQQAVQEDLARGRISGKRFMKIDQLYADARTAFAGLLSVRPEQVALTSGTVDGLEIALTSLNFGLGDVVLTTDIEHPAARDALERHCARNGMGIDTLEIAETDADADIVARFAERVGDGVAAILVSDVAFGTGRRLPIEQICALALHDGLRVIVDGAQAAGARAVDCARLGADFYALPGQKWLMGPEGAGALVVSETALTASGLESAAALERGSRSKSIWAGMLAALSWRKALGTEAEIEQAIAANRRRLVDGLSGLDGVSVVTPAEAAGLVAFMIAGCAADDILKAFGAERLAVRDIAGTDRVRISCGLFTAANELDAVIRVVASLCMATSNFEATP